MSITTELRKYVMTLALTGDYLLIEQGIVSNLTHIAGRIDAALVERYVELPEDADGEPIHIGDVMEWCDPDGEVTVTCEVDAVGVECFFAWDGANGRYAQKSANAYRHHHAPTVEDVLREFSCVLMGKREFDGDVTEAIAEYAAKLRLAGEDA